MTRKKKKSEYPRLEELGVVVHRRDDVPSHVLWSDVRVAVTGKWGEAGLAKFGKLFGVQTCLAEGPYPWDVEAVLERMSSGRLTGTQAYWD
jgi:hypothetical protein